MPVLHSVHAAEESAPVVLEYVPAAQLVHAAEESAPVVFEYVPAVQLVHAEESAPVVFEYVPAVQGVHDEAPLLEYVPAVQGVHDEAPLLEYVPAVQGVHDEGPFAQVPAGQPLHELPEIVLVQICQPVPTILASELQDRLLPDDRYTSDMHADEPEYVVPLLLTLRVSQQFSEAKAVEVMYPDTVVRMLHV